MGNMNNNMNNSMIYNSYDPNMMMGSNQIFATQQDEGFEFIDEDFDVRRVQSNTEIVTEREAGVYVNGKRVENKSKLEDDKMSYKSIPSSAKKAPSSATKPVHSLADRRKMTSSVLSKNAATKSTTSKK
jgi:hypothetical protein